MLLFYTACSSLSQYEKAGERIRTADVQLGKLETGKYKVSSGKHLLLGLSGLTFCFHTGSQTESRLFPDWFVQDLLQDSYTPGTPPQQTGGCLWRSEIGLRYTYIVGLLTDPIQKLLSANNEPLAQARIRNNTFYKIPPNNHPNRPNRPKGPKTGFRRALCAHHTVNRVFKV